MRKHLAAIVLAILLFCSPAYAVFPTVGLSAVDRTLAVDTTDFFFTMPSGIVAGDLLVGILSVDEAPTLTLQTGYSGTQWNTLASGVQSTNVTSVLYWKIAEGIGDQLYISSSTAQQGSFIMTRITNGRLRYASTVASGNTTNPDPATLTVATGSRDFLWIAYATTDSTTVATVCPASFASLTTIAAAGTGGASTSLCTRSQTSNTQATAAFTAVTGPWVAWTVGIAPLSARVPMTGAGGS